MNQHDLDSNYKPCHLKAIPDDWQKPHRLSNTREPLYERNLTEIPLLHPLRSSASQGSRVLHFRGTELVKSCDDCRWLGWLAASHAQPPSSAPRLGCWGWGLPPLPLGKPPCSVNSTTGESKRSFASHRYIHLHPVICGCMHCALQVPVCN